MNRPIAMALVVITLIFITSLIVTGFDVSPPTSEESQVARMYVVFGAYLVLLFAVRWLLRATGTRAQKGWLRTMKLGVASIAVGGTAYVLGIVLCVVIGGADAVGSMVVPLLLAVPAVAIAFLPFAAKWMR
jgi:hypothetical protein